MSTSNLEKFASLVRKDPALLTKLGVAKLNADAKTMVDSAGAFLKAAVEEAKALGLEFTEAEALAFMEADESNSNYAISGIARDSATKLYIRKAVKLSNGSVIVTV